LDPLLGGPDHRGGATAPAPAPPGGTGAPHTGQTTDAADITLLQFGQNFAPDWSGGGGIETGDDGGVHGEGGGTEAPTGAGRQVPDGRVVAPAAD
jgi:hypothetical protein